MLTSFQSQNSILPAWGSRRGHRLAVESGSPGGAGGRARADVLLPEHLREHEHLRFLSFLHSRVSPSHDVSEVIGLMSV